MQNLINNLINGNVEFQEGGVVINRPPNTVALRAARELTNLSNMVANNNMLIMQLQQRVNDQLQEILTLQGQLNESNRTTAAVPSVCEDTGEVSEVGSPSEQPSGSDSDGEGRGTN